MKYIKHKENPTSFKKGLIPWNKGKKGLMPTPWNKGIKGIHLSSKTEFKKGQLVNEKNFQWKGEDVGYGNLHSWIKRKLGKAKKCEQCGSTTRVQWANVSHLYKRDLDDYVQLCNWCHFKHDGIAKLDWKRVEKIRELANNGIIQTDIAKKYDVDQTTISKIVNNITWRTI
jgi:hypothetical protein